MMNSNEALKILRFHCGDLIHQPENRIGNQMENTS